MSLIRRRKKGKKVKLKKKKEKIRKVESALLSPSFLKGQIKKVLKLVGREKDKKLEKDLKLLYKKGLRNRKRVNEELLHLDQMIKEEPQEIEHRIRKIQLESSNPTSSLEQAKNLLYIAPEESLDVAFANLSWSFASTRQSKECLLAARKALEYNPSNGLAKICISHAIQQPECFSGISQEERSKEVFRHIEEAISAEPENFLFLIIKCWAQKEARLFDESFKTVETAKKFVTWEHEHLYFSYLASIYFMLAYREETILNSLRSVLLEPRSLTSMSMLSSSYDLYFDYESSLDLGEKFTNFHSANVGMLDECLTLFLAVNYMNVGKYNDAINMCQECLKTRKSARSHGIIANCLWYINNPNQRKEAIEHCEKALQNREDDLADNGTLYSIYADLLFDAGRIFECGMNFLEAERVNPGVFDLEKKRLLESPESPQARDFEGRLEKIFEFFDRLIKRGSDDKTIFRCPKKERIKKKRQGEIVFGEKEWECLERYYSQLVGSRDGEVRKRDCKHLFYKVLHWVDRTRGDYDIVAKYNHLMEEREMVMGRWAFLINMMREEDYNIGNEKTVVVKLDGEVLFHSPKYIFF